MKQKTYDIPDRQQFAEALKKCGLKATAQRLAIHDAMMVLGHASADMVLDYLKQNSEVKITTASVYNTLTQMAESGMYSMLSSSNNKMYFDVRTSRHFHMYDCENHVFRDVVDDDLYNAVIQKIGHKRFRGYNLIDIDIHFVVKPSSKRRKLK